MCEYLYSYAARFDLFKYICFDTSVLSVTRRSGGHVVAMQNNVGLRKDVWFDAIAVCSGLHVHPEMPHIPNMMDNIKHVYHSSEVKSRTQFGMDTNVVILGAGETAMDLAYLAVTSPTKSVTLCHRDGFLCGPKASATPLTRWSSPLTLSRKSRPHES